MIRTAALILTFLTLLAEPVSAADGGGAEAFDLDDRDTIAQIRELPPRALDEVVWLARCIYSESNRSHEQQLVAWVVRNRVETEFRGDTYRDVVLNPAQFSAFNTPNPRRRRILNLTLDSHTPGWRQALKTAYQVYRAPDEQRPFPETTRHFYSPISMSTDRPPQWTDNHSPIPSASLGVLPQRFQFYDGVDRSQAASTPGLRQTQLPTRTARYESASAARSADEDQLSLQELRNSIRRRLFRGRIKRPRRPTVKSPSRPERAQ